MKLDRFINSHIILHYSPSDPRCERTNDRSIAIFPSTCAPPKLHLACPLTFIRLSHKCWFQFSVVVAVAVAAHWSPRWCWQFRFVVDFTIKTLFIYLFGLNEVCETNFDLVSDFVQLLPPTQEWEWSARAVHWCTTTLYPVLQLPDWI